MKTKRSLHLRPEYVASFMFPSREVCLILQYFRSEQRYCGSFSSHFPSTGEHSSHQNQMWCVNIGQGTFLGSIDRGIVPFLGKNILRLTEKLPNIASACTTIMLKVSFFFSKKIVFFLGRGRWVGQGAKGPQVKRVRQKLGAKPYCTYVLTYSRQHATSFMGSDLLCMAIYALPVRVGVLCCFSCVDHPLALNRCLVCVVFSCDGRLQQWVSCTAVFSRE